MDIKQTSSGVAAYQASDDAAASIYEKRNSITGEVCMGGHGADNELERLLSTRHVTMIALGSFIAMGLWLGSGTSLTSGGPAIPSAISSPDKFVNPAAAFALGWSYWYSYCITIANELQAANTIIRFWTNAVPIAAWITIWWAAIVLTNINAVSVFGKTEAICSSIKFR
ncbi:hypothetical protein DL771_002829 [Monosporascus sp. 5C6A]|nr:hypothetical protein DL771_002829 [Monosporascus sp. 5C6A]